MKFFKKHFRQIYRVCLILLAVMIGGSSLGAEPRYVPFDHKVAATLLRNTVAQKLAPSEFKGDGMTLKIIKLNQFVMDWEKSQFTLDFGFRASYNKGFVNLDRIGAVSVTGSGLMAADEQKLGVKLLRINDLKLEGGSGWIDSAARMILDKSLSGKEFWHGTPPTTSQGVTKDNLGLLLQVALNQTLPKTVINEETTVTLKRVEQLTFGAEPGVMRSRIAMNGNYQKLFNFSFVGQIGVAVQVMVDPEQLAGKIMIDQVTDLQLDKSPALLDGIIRRMVNAKLKGETVEFSWE